MEDAVQSHSAQPRGHYPLVGECIGGKGKVIVVQDSGSELMTLANPRTLRDSVSPPTLLI